MKMKKRRLFTSLSTTINTFFILLLVLFTLLTGAILYYIANTQIFRDSEMNMENILNQKMEYLTFLYRDAFEQFYELTESPAIERFSDQSALSAQAFLGLSEEAEAFYNRNSAFVDSLYIYMENGDFVIAESEQQVVDASFDPATLYSYFPEAREGFRWLNSHTDSVFTRHQEVQSLLRIIEDQEGEPAGILLVNFKVAYIDSLLQDNLPEDTYMMLLSEEGRHVPAGVVEREDLNRQIDRLYRVGTFPEETTELAVSGKGSYLLTSSPIPTNKWQVVLLSPKRGLFNSLPVIVVFILLAVVLLAVLAAFFFRVIRRYISSPITTMSSRILAMEQINEKLEITPGIPQELAVLYESFNELADRNGRLIQEITAQQEEKLDLEIALLHAQISPHFLYNTLYSIKGLCELGLNQEASEMISKLSDFFRTSLSRGKEVITIHEELKNIESYLYLMEMRYGDFFSYVIQVPEGLRDYSIVKLSLQPLIENAIYHGVMEDRGAGSILIRAQEEEAAIVLSIQDNGKGIEAEKLERIQAELGAPYLSQEHKTVGVGLRSVDIRIKNRYGSGFGLVMESQLGAGTRVSIRIPKVRGGKLV